MSPPHLMLLLTILPDAPPRSCSYWGEDVYLNLSGQPCGGFNVPGCAKWSRLGDVPDPAPVLAAPLTCSSFVAGAPVRACVRVSAGAATHACGEHVHGVGSALLRRQRCQCCCYQKHALRWPPPAAV
jgi:hypothetical protein